MSTRRRLCTLLFALATSVSATGSEPTPPAADLPVVRIALFEDGRAESEDDSLEQLRRELRDRTAERAELEFPAACQRAGDWTASGVAAELDALASAGGYDLLIATGPIGSAELCRRSPSVPAIGMRVLDAQLQGAPFRGPGSGVPNLNYLVAPLNLARDLEAYRELLELASLQLVVSPELADALPDFFEGVRSELVELGVRVELLRLDAATKLDGLGAGCDAVLFAPLPTLSRADFERVATALVERGLPAFSLIGPGDVRRGLLASHAPENDSEALAERTALHVARLIDGEPAEQLPTSIGGREHLTLNTTTALRLDLRPRFDVLAEAELVGEERDPDRPTLSLPFVMREALAVDRNLLAAEMELLARSEDVARARASLLPQLDLSAAWTVIDDDQASLGRAERTLSGRLSGSQVLYSEALGAAVDIEQGLQAAREADLAAQSLDVVEVAAKAYLNVLRAKSLDRIRREDLRLSRSNLELARSRKELGLTGPAEVYRWESQIATGRRAVLDAQADLRIAELEVNRVLHQPLEQDFETEEVGVEDRGLFVDERLEPFIDNPWDFEVLASFEVRAGLAEAPELASLDDAIRAAERELTSARRAHWQPVVSLDGSIVDVFDASGTGSQIPPGFGGIIPDPEMTTWSASLLGSFPLLTGGAKRSRERRARHELVRLRYLRAATAQFIEQRIRGQLASAAASFAGIRLSRRASEAAERNLELVIDSYSSGVLSIIDLLEAQNAALLAREAASNAVYDFALDMVGVQRAVGQFSLFTSVAASDLWFEELARFAAAPTITLAR